MLVDFKNLLFKYCVLVGLNNYLNIAYMLRPE